MTGRLPRTILLCLLLVGMHGCAIVRLFNFARGQKLLVVDPNNVTFHSLRADAQLFLA